MVMSRKIRTALVASAFPLVMSLAAPGSAEVLKADTAYDLGQVGGFTATRDWDVNRSDRMVRITAPEGDLVATLVEVGEAADAKAAAAIALSLANAKSRPLETLTARAPVDGWDERASADYTVPPAEHAELSVTLLRKGKVWTAFVIDGSQATAEKRLAALGAMVISIRPKGFVREDFAGKPAHALTPARIEMLRAFLAQAMKELQVPGVGLALIERGKIVYEGGLGVKRLGGSDPVGAHTRFMIASNTKGMSTLLLAMLADDGKVRWDQPVTQVYPEFRLGSDATTRAVVMRQLVCACTGLPRKDMELLIATRHDTPASDTFQQLAATEPTSKFGEVFQYNNLMAAAAGYIGGALAYPALELGAAYDKAMQVRVFDPLGMKDTTFDMRKGTSGDHADPSVLDIRGRAIVAPQTLNYQFYPFRPAGGAWSSAHDVAQYVRLELAEGVAPSGERLVSTANLLERRRHNVPVSEDSWYGMGLETRRRYGVDVVFHGGSLLGYQTNWFALPQAGVGAVVLTNSDEGVKLLDPFLRRLVEVLWDGRPEAAARVTSAANATQAELAALRAKLSPGEPALAALDLAPRYRNASLGTVSFAKVDGVTHIKVGPFDNTVAAQKNPDGTWSVVMTGPDLTGFDALVGKDAAGKRTLTMRDAQHTYVFTEE